MNTRQDVWLPIIDSAACNGCGDCVVACPTDALTLDGGVPAGSGFAPRVEPDRCGYCAVCEAVCPTDAIALPYQIVLAASAG